LAREGAELSPTPEGEVADYRAALEKLRPESGVTVLGRDIEAIAVPLDGARRLVLARKAEPALAFAFRRETALVLGAFWIFSVALAWAIARGVVLPLRTLAQRLPTIEHDAGGALPGVERSDEIGQVARAYLAARAQLAAEREARERAERQALLGRMATGLAHEIHNPLTAIRMHAQLLQSTAPDEIAPALEESLPILLEETVRIEGLVNQWMFLARPEPPRTSILHLADVVESVVRSRRSMATHAGVGISVDLPADSSVSADARRLSQAVANVVINAIQAMGRGGQLTITGAQRDGVVQLVFQDTGAGFSTEALTRYRELFFTQKEGGMGIGLSVTAEILEAHGGRLEAANAPEGGAMVTFTLPAAKADAAVPVTL
jgi:signal transduction histidine kinase